MTYVSFSLRIVFEIDRSIILEHWPIFFSTQNFSILLEHYRTYSRNQLNAIIYYVWTRWLHHNNTEINQQKKREEKKKKQKLTKDKYVEYNLFACIRFSPVILHNSLIMHMMEFGRSDFFVAVHCMCIVNAYRVIHSVYCSMWVIKLKYLLWK